MFMVIFYDKF
jgi:SH3-domain binding protein 5